MRCRSHARLGSVLAVLATAVLFPLFAPTSGQAGVVPSGFVDQTVLTGLSAPTNLEFAADGRVFVAEKGGRVKVFDNLADPTADTLVDFRDRVQNFWDRGMLGLALAPNFPTDPYLYVLYTYDAAIGGTFPRWGDDCPTPPGATADGCVVSGRLSRLQVSGNQVVGGEQVLINDWCAQYPSHTIGDLAFGADGALYVSAGDGASFNFADYGQDAAPAGNANPCGDPPGPVGTPLSPPTAQGGALRSQDVRTLTDPTTLDGAVLRLDPATGLALPSNPLYNTTSDPNARRIVAQGFRNPYRITARPGTNEIWVGDVGWSRWEEINRIANPTASLLNFGWPCHEGAERQTSYDSANLDLCESLYTSGGAVNPVFAYNHSATVVPGETCPTGGSASSGVAFYPESGGNYPAEYRGALFFADVIRDCIWAMMPGVDGLPDPAAIRTFDAGAAAPVDLEIGPGGDLYYVDITGGTIHRIQYFAANRPPVADAQATPTSGAPPLAVQFDGTVSSDPDPGDTLAYAWDFTGDGTVDATGSTAAFTYPGAGQFTASLRVTDGDGASSVDTVTITVGQGAPVPTIDTPAASLTWKVGDPIAFSGHAVDPDQGTLPPSALRWRLILHHCTGGTTDCHEHVVQTYDDVAGGSFVAPDHEYPSYLELELTATDSGGLAGTTSVRLDPKTVTLTFQTVPAGLPLTVGQTTATTPFTQTVIAGSSNTVSATPQTVGGTHYGFSSWSDGGAATHTLVAPVSATYTATYAQTRVTGTVVNQTTGRPVANARLDLMPSGRSARTSAAGTFTFLNVAPGSYTLKASLGTDRCGPSVTIPVTVDGVETVNPVVAQRVDAFGYTCVDQTRAFAAGTTATAVTGNNATGFRALPFGFRFYGTTYTGVNLSTNGFLSFTAGSTAAANTSLPTAAAPNAAVYAFWDDLSVDASSRIYVASSGATPNRRYVVEWRNVLLVGTANRVSVSVELFENGEIWINYKDIAANAREQGSSATVGIENATGTVGLPYAVNVASLASGRSILFRPPP